MAMFQNKFAGCPGFPLGLWSPDEQHLAFNFGCLKIGILSLEFDGWRPLDINNPSNHTGREKCAIQIQNEIGGEIHRITPIDDNAEVLGRYIGVNVMWGHHEVIVRDGKVFDSFGPIEGASISDFKNQFQYTYGLDLDFKIYV